MLARSVLPPQNKGMWPYRASALDTFSPWGCVWGHAPVPAGMSCAGWKPALWNGRLDWAHHGQCASCLL